MLVNVEGADFVLAGLYSRFYRKVSGNLNTLRGVVGCGLSGSLFRRQTMMKSPISLLALLATASNAYETYHHGVIGHWENVGPCENAELLEPKCAEGSTLCPNKKVRRQWI